MKRFFELLKNEWRLVLAWAALTLAYATLSLFRHWHFESNAWDMGIFDQAIWHYSRFEIPASSIRGFSNLMGDHFSPLLAVFAPLFWVFHQPSVPLLWAQALLVTLPMFPIFFFTEKRLGRFPAYGYALTYAVFPGIQHMVQFDFHELCLGVALAAFAVYFLDEGRWKLFFTCVFLLMLVKEDLCLLSAFFGLLVVLKGFWKRGALLTAVSLLIFYLEIHVLIPHFNEPGKGYSYWGTYYGQFGSGPLEALPTLLLHPFLDLQTFFSNSQKIGTLAWTFGTFLFTAFFSPLIVLTIPLLAERMLSSYEPLWEMSFHYSAVIAPVVCFASAEGLFNFLKLVRPPEKRKKWLSLLCGFMLTASLVLVPIIHVSPLAFLFKPSFYQTTPAIRTSREAFNLIPPDASVLTQWNIVPHLSHRQDIRVIGQNTFSSPFPEDYVVVCLDLNFWPIENREKLQAGLDQIEKSGYVKIFEKDGWVILRKPGVM